MSERAVFMTENDLRVSSRVALLRITLLRISLLRVDSLRGPRVLSGGWVLRVAPLARRGNRLLLWRLYSRFGSLQGSKSSPIQGRRKLCYVHHIPHPSLHVSLNKSSEPKSFKILCHSGYLHGIEALLDHAWVAVSLIQLHLCLCLHACTDPAQAQRQFNKTQRRSPCRNCLDQEMQIRPKQDICNRRYTTELTLNPISRAAVTPVQVLDGLELLTIYSAFVGQCNLGAKEA